MFVIRNKLLFTLISALFVAASIIGLFKNGLNLSIEFTGGSVMEVSYEEAPDLDLIKSSVAEAGFDAQVQAFGETNVIVRTQDLTETERQSLVTALTITDDGTELVPSEERFNSIGPSIGQELRRKAIISIVIVALAIILFVGFAFRKVSKPVASWKYGVIAVIALIHDVLIPIGVFAFLGKTVDSLFVVGILSILGLSVNDTIVVFDRVRENLQKNEEKGVKEKFHFTVGRSISQTVARSINTSLTLIVVLVALFAFGPVATRDLALVLLIGTLLGTYSSIFLASPLLTMFNKTKD